MHDNGLTLEKAKVVERLTVIETKFDVVKDDITEIKDMLKCFPVRIDRLEPSEHLRQKHINRIWVVVCGLGGKIIWDFFKK